MSRLDVFPRFKKRLADAITTGPSVAGEGPTIQNLANRQEFIRKRMGAIIGAIKANASKETAGKGKNAEKELENSMEEISKDTQLIKKTYDQVEEKVNRVLVYTGEVVLPEEEEQAEASTPEPREMLLPDGGPFGQSPQGEAGRPERTQEKEVTHG